MAFNCFTDVVSCWFVRLRIRMPAVIRECFQQRRAAQYLMVHAVFGGLSHTLSSAILCYICVFLPFWPHSFANTGQQLLKMVLYTHWECEFQILPWCLQGHLYVVVSSKWLHLASPLVILEQRYLGTWRTCKSNAGPRENRSSPSISFSLEPSIICLWAMGIRFTSCSLKPKFACHPLLDKCNSLVRGWEGFFH